MDPRRARSWTQRRVALLRRRNGRDVAGRDSHDRFGPGHAVSSPRRRDAAYIGEDSGTPGALRRSLLTAPVRDGRGRPDPPVGRSHGGVRGQPATYEAGWTYSITYRRDSKAVVIASTDGTTWTADTRIDDGTSALCNSRTEPVARRMGAVFPSCPTSGPVQWPAGSDPDRRDSSPRDRSRWPHGPPHRR